jgi:type IV pilus assembly protein PilW
MLSTTRSKQSHCKHRAGPRGRHLGLSLIELMVAMTIGLFMLGALSLVYIQAKSSFNYVSQMIRMTEDATVALETISGQTRMAGFSGCAGAAPGVQQLQSAASTAEIQKFNPFYSNNAFPELLDIYAPRTALYGFSANNSAALQLVQSASYKASTSSAMLFLRGVSSDSVSIGAQSYLADTASAYLLLETDYFNWADRGASFFMIANCTASEVFRGEFLASGSSTAQGANIHLSNSYNQGTMLAPLTSDWFFLATRKGQTHPSLYMRSFHGGVNSASVSEVVANVEAMTFQYGENTENRTSLSKHCGTGTGEGGSNGDGLPTYLTDHYQSSAEEVKDWSRVISIRIGLIMVSEDELQTSGGKTIAWLGGTYTPPVADKRLRRAYSTTVLLRNRSGLPYAGSCASTVSNSTP